MEKVFEDIFINGNLSWQNVALIAISIAAIILVMKIRAKYARKGQKQQAVSEILGTTWFAVGIVIDLPTATGTIQAKVTGIDEDFVHLKSKDPKQDHHVPVAKFATGVLSNRVSCYPCENMKNNSV